MNQQNLQQVIDALMQVIDWLYQENTEPAYKILFRVLPLLEEVIGEIEQESIQVEIKEQLIEALNAMENTDHILLADIMQYEIVERLQGYVV